MRGLDLPAKKCDGCRKPMTRRRWSDGRLEAPSVFRRRRFHSNDCKAIGMLRSHRRSTDTGRVCLQCGADLRRKRYPAGDWEPRSSFNGRRWCDVECMRLYYEDILHQIERADERRNARALAVAERLAKVNRGICFHDSFPSDCTFCARLQILITATKRCSGRSLRSAA